jgi:hypothetical protein
MSRSSRDDHPRAPHIEAAKRGRTNAAASGVVSAKPTRAFAGHRQLRPPLLPTLTLNGPALSAKGGDRQVAPIRFVAELIGAERVSELAIRWLIALTVLCATSCYRFDGSGSGTEVNPTLQGSGRERQCSQLGSASFFAIGGRPALSIPITAFDRLRNIRGRPMST